ncbi:phosphotransferase [Bacillus spongiae]|uniref:Phosphotransferase n=1 Tax=Bacillus spongiae TaxID=2683610 RepID=A0ABU8HHG6_9BACI
MEKSYIRLNGGFHNEVFYIPSIDKVVRISEKRKTKARIVQEIEWMKYLKNNGVEVPSVDKVEDKTECLWTYFEFIKGTQLDVTKDSHWNGCTFEELGRILGRMHALSKNFKVSAIERPVWTSETTDVFEIRHKLSPWLKGHYNNFMNNLLLYKKTVDTFGLIHNDFHQGNIIMDQNDSLVTIDFDECSFNWFAQDLAVVFYHAYWQNSSFNDNQDYFTQEFMTHFFNGYKSENFLHEDIIKQIPIFLKLREIFLYQLFITKWDLNNLGNWQQYTLDNLNDNIKGNKPYAGVSDFSIYV